MKKLLTRGYLYNTLTKLNPNFIETEPSRLATVGYTKQHYSSSSTKPNTSIVTEEDLSPNLLPTCNRELVLYLTNISSNEPYTITLPDNYYSLYITLISSSNNNLSYFIPELSSRFDSSDLFRNVLTKSTNIREFNILSNIVNPNPGDFFRIGTKCSSRDLVTTAYSDEPYSLRNIPILEHYNDLLIHPSLIARPRYRRNNIRTVLKGKSIYEEYTDQPIECTDTILRINRLLSIDTFNVSYNTSTMSRSNYYKILDINNNPVSTLTKPRLARSLTHHSITELGYSLWIRAISKDLLELSLRYKSTPSKAEVIANMEVPNNTVIDRDFLKLSPDTSTSSAFRLDNNVGDMMESLTNVVFLPLATSDNRINNAYLSNIQNYLI